MTRGRRPIPNEIKRLKGNPHKGKLILDGLEGKTPHEDAPALLVDPPDFLTSDREKEAFRMILDALPASMVRKSDLTAIARYCTWLTVWVNAKLQLDGRDHFYETESKHGRMLREHPQGKILANAEARLMALEDRLCLNITSRNAVTHRLFQMPTPPPLPAGDGDEPPEDNDSPLGFVAQAGKPN